MNTDPFSEQILWPTSLDTFPNCMDKTNASVNTVPEKYTKMWASHFNKINNFIKIAQPLLKTTSAQSDGTIQALTYVIRLPRVKLWDIHSTFPGLTGGYYLPSNVYPFEFTLTASQDDYSGYPNNSGSTPFLVQLSQADINTMFGGYNIFGLVPSVSVSIARATGLTTHTTSRWITNCYVYMGVNTILVRGCIIDTTCPVYTSLPTESDAGMFYSDIVMDCVITGLTVGGFSN